MSPKAKKTTKIIVNVILWIFLVLALAITVFAFIANASGKSYPKIGNKCLLCVESESMTGKEGFYKGDLIICDVLTGDQRKDLKEGDVITFYMNIEGNEELNTHRIIKVENDGVLLKFTTHGDNNPEGYNETVYESRVEAKWTGKRIAGLGAVMGFLRSSVGFLVCIVLPLAAFFIYELVVLILTITKVKAGKKKNISKEEEELIKQRAVEEYLQKIKEQEAAKTLADNEENK